MSDLLPADSFLADLQNIDAYYRSMGSSVAMVIERAGNQFFGFGPAPAPPPASQGATGGTGATGTTGTTSSATGATGATGSSKGA